MELVWSVLCNKVIVDRFTNMVSLVEALDAIETSDELPKASEEDYVMVGPLTITLASYWVRTKEDAPEVSKVRVYVVAPSGNLVGPEPLEVKVDLTETTARHVFMNLTAFPFCGVGKYQFELQYYDEATKQWIPVRRNPISIRKKQEANEPGDSGKGEGN